MKLKVDRYSIKIIPDNETDEAYLEEVLNLKRKGDGASAKRVNASGLSCWAYLEIKPDKDDKPSLVKELEEVKKERDSMCNRIVHCEDCGGSWYDDGNNLGCTCQALKQRTLEIAKTIWNFSQTLHEEPCCTDCWELITRKYPEYFKETEQ